jgi:hypothetical protein
VDGLLCDDRGSGDAAFLFAGCWLALADRRWVMGDARLTLNPFLFFSCAGRCKTPMFMMVGGWQDSPSTAVTGKFADACPVEQRHLFPAATEALEALALEQIKADVYAEAGGDVSDGDSDGDSDIVCYGSGKGDGGAASAMDTTATPAAITATAAAVPKESTGGGGGVAMDTDAAAAVSGGGDAVHEAQGQNEGPGAVADDAMEDTADLKPFPGMRVRASFVDENGATIWE